MSGKRQIITVTILAEQHQDGTWVMTSDDLPEFLLAGKDLHILEQDIPSTIQIIMENNYRFKTTEVSRLIQPKRLNQRTEAPIYETPSTWAACGAGELAPAS